MVFLFFLVIPSRIEPVSGCLIHQISGFQSLSVQMTSSKYLAPGYFNRHQLTLQFVRRGNEIPNHRLQRRVIGVAFLAAAVPAYVSSFVVGATIFNTRW